jgi:hypothetical protein
VLCYFAHVEKSEPLPTKPVLLITQLMYPGAMILEAAIEGWIKGESHEQIRLRAAQAYAGNQKTSVKAALTVFSKN